MYVTNAATGRSSRARLGEPLNAHTSLSVTVVIIAVSQRNSIAGCKTEIVKINAMKKRSSQVILVI